MATNTKNTSSDWKEREIGALWLKTSKSGNKMLTGNLNGKKVVVFKNKNKSNENSPDYRVYLSELENGDKTVAPAKKKAAPASFQKKARKVEPEEEVEEVEETEEEGTEEEEELL